MGVFGGRDNFSPNWITAMIVDSRNRLHLVPIKNTVGDDYFVADINKETYAFKIEPSRIMIWYATFTKSFRVLWYTTAHNMPISAADNKELEQIIEINSLPKMNRLQFTMFKELTKREKFWENSKREFEPHSLTDLIAELNKHKLKNTEALQNLARYLTELQKDQIVTPLKHITEFLWDDFFKTDPKYLATVPESMIRAEEQNRKVTNSDNVAKKGWMKLLLIVMGIAVVGMVLYMAYSSGAFNQITGPFDAVGNFFKTQNAGHPAGSGPSGLPSECQGPPEQCKAAIDSGKVKLAQLPAELRKVMENFKGPVLTPTNNEVVIGGQ